MTTSTFQSHVYRALKQEIERIKPSKEEIFYAKKIPNGWVYRISADYANGTAVPNAGIIGGWKVDAFGNIRDEFIHNPCFKQHPHEKQHGLADRPLIALSSCQSQAIEQQIELN